MINRVAHPRVPRAGARSRALFAAFALAAASTPARAQEPAGDRCAPVSNAESQRQTRRYNDGLPALGTLMMAGAAGVVLATVLGTTLGVVATVERAETLPERVAGGAGAFLLLSAGMLTATTTGLLGFAIWFIAWLPPVRSTLRRCPPPRAAP